MNSSQYRPRPCCVMRPPQGAVSPSAASAPMPRAAASSGAASAAEAAGNATLAHQYFRKLTEFAVGDERPELVTARNKMSVTAEK